MKPGDIKERKVTGELIYKTKNVKTEIKRENKNIIQSQLLSVVDPKVRRANRVPWAKKVPKALRWLNVGRKADVANVERLETQAFRASLVSVTTRGTPERLETKASKATLDREETQASYKGD